jgi:hypothetical protein
LKLTRLRPATLPANAQASAAFAMRAASFNLEWISVRMILIAGSIAAWSMAAYPLSATTHTSHAWEVQQILSNLMTLFSGRRASYDRVPNKAALI